MTSINWLRLEKLYESAFLLLFSFFFFLYVQFAEKFPKLYEWIANNDYILFWCIIWESTGNKNKKIYIVCLVHRKFNVFLPNKAIRSSYDASFAFAFILYLSILSHFGKVRIISKLIRETVIDQPQSIFLLRFLDAF